MILERLFHLEIYSCIKEKKMPDKMFKKKFI